MTLHSCFQPASLTPHPARLHYKWRHKTLLLQTKTQDAVTTNEDTNCYYYKWRGKKLLLHTKTQTVIITNEDTELYDYKQRHKLLLLQMKSQTAIITNEDTNCYCYKLRQTVLFFTNRHSMLLLQTKTPNVCTWWILFFSRPCLYAMYSLHSCDQLIYLLLYNNNNNNKMYAYMQLFMHSYMKYIRAYIQW